VDPYLLFLVCRHGVQKDNFALLLIVNFIYLYTSANSASAVVLNQRSAFLSFLFPKWVFGNHIWFQRFIRIFMKCQGTVGLRRY